MDKVLSMLKKALKYALMVTVVTEILQTVIEKLEPLQKSKIDK